MTVDDAQVPARALPDGDPVGGPLVGSDWELDLTEDVLRLVVRAEPGDPGIAIPVTEELVTSLVEVVRSLTSDPDDTSTSTTTAADGDPVAVSARGGRFTQLGLKAAKWAEGTVDRTVTSSGSVQVDRLLGRVSSRWIWWAAVALLAVLVIVAVFS